MQLSLFQPEPLPEKATAPSPVRLTIRRKDEGGEVNGYKDERKMISGLLEPHLPVRSIDYILDWLMEEKVQLRITRNRSSKMGDYRPPKPGTSARISVNHNLNEFSFLITLVHEMAHHLVPGKVAGNKFIGSFRRKKRPKPHGPEWQSRYRKLMEPLLIEEIFPPDVLASMEQYLENPKASTAGDMKLFRVLKKYDSPDGTEFIENLPFDAAFQLRNGLTFHKKEKIRKRYRCVCINNGRNYLFNPMSQVYRLEKS